MAFKIVQIIEPPRMPDEETAIRAIEEMGGEFIMKNCESTEEIIAIAHDADFIITVGNQRPISRSVIEKLEKCRFIQTRGIGYDGIDVEAATEHGIGVINNPDFCLEEMSDHVMALILDCSRRIAQLDSMVKAGKLSSFAMRRQTLWGIWLKMGHLRGKTLGFIGFGRIARATVPKAKGFGMNILAYDPYVPQGVGDELGAQIVDITQLLQDSDFVSLNAALTSETKHLIGLEELRKMKPSAYLINTARGPLVDERALYEALTKGYIAGAGLDATDPDPPALDSPLLKLDNVILTGHSGFASSSALNKLGSVPLEEAARVMRGEWPRGLVNPEVKQKKNVRGPISQRR